jgi:hypothetical protein
MTLAALVFGVIALVLLAYVVLQSVPPMTTAEEITSGLAFFGSLGAGVLAMLLSRLAPSRTPAEKRRAKAAAVLGILPFAVWALDTMVVFVISVRSPLRTPFAPSLDSRHQFHV